MKILFLCVANAARSQMAEGLAKAMFKEQVNVESAGSRPAPIHSLAIEVMAELGIDISMQRSKPLESISLHGIDLIITLCAEEICPVAPVKTRKLHWPIADPVSAPERRNPLECFRDARNAIENKLHGLAKEMKWEVHCAKR